MGRSSDSSGCGGDRERVSSTPPMKAKSHRTMSHAVRVVILAAGALVPLANALVAFPSRASPFVPHQYRFPPQRSGAASLPKCNLEDLRVDAPSRVRSRFILSAASDDNPPASKPTALGTLNVATVVGSATAAAIVRRVATSGAPRLFVQHVVGAALAALLFLPAALGAVRSRVGAVKALKGAPATERRSTLMTHVFGHFYLTYAAAGCAALSLGSIFVHKARMGKAHFVSGHSRVGLAAAALWFASYVVAQAKVWTPMLKRGEFKYAPTLLWASQWHKSLGTAAAAVSVGAVGTGVGMSAWGRGAFGPVATAVILAGIAAIEAYILLPPIRERRQRSKRRQASRKKE